MKILARKSINGRTHIYYATEKQDYVYHMSSKSQINPKKLIFRGWLCSFPTWERTFKKSIVGERGRETHAKI